MLKTIFGAEPPHGDLLEALSDIKDRIENAENLFENTGDPDLIEASIYELKALQARRCHLLRLAKEQNAVGYSVLLR